MNIMRHLIISISIWVTFAHAAAAAEARLVHIKSHAAQYYTLTGETYFTNDVLIEWENNYVAADQVQMKRDQHNQFQEIIASSKNKLSHYWTKPSLTHDAIQAYAQTIKFYPMKSLVILLGKVSLTKNHNNFNGEIMIYNIKKHQITVPGNHFGKATMVMPNQKFKV